MISLRHRIVSHGFASAPASTRNWGLDVVGTRQRLPTSKGCDWARGHARPDPGNSVEDRRTGGRQGATDHAMELDDRDAVYRQFFDKKQREYLRTVICDEIIEEHRKSPLGQHTEPLERLLLYFRHAPQRDKYVIKRDCTSGKFRIARLSGDRDAPLSVVSDEEYAAAEAAYHEIFLRRVRELLESDA